jgi:GrpB-like predicted nucleotidyltransferase (UPF0157 family)
VQRAPQSKGLRETVLDLALDHEAIEVAALIRISASVRAEEDHFAGAGAASISALPARSIISSAATLFMLGAYKVARTAPPCAYVRLHRMNRTDRARATAEDLARAGGRDAPVEIVEYDPAWPGLFAAECERIEPLLGGADVHHFGSTAVPGLAAKPVIDMIALVDDLDAHIAALTTSGGYQFPRAFNATLAHRRFLCYPSPTVRTHHLHLVDQTVELERRLRFRDRLRADAALAEEYATLKRALAERHREDREAYTEAKAEFIRANLGRL